MRKIQRRRRIEAKTDYKARLNLLKSGKPRIVIRKTNKYILIQLVQSDLAQDKVIASVSSKDLLLNGWPEKSAGSLKSRAASYLTGLLLAKKLNKKVEEAILDIGMYRNIQKSRIYAALKGVVDSGIKVPHSAEALPTDESIALDKYKSFFNKIKEKLNG